MITAEDKKHLSRCVELARQALDAGDQPFGSVLVSGDGRVLFEDHNHVSSGDRTRHPEFEIARWAANNVPPADRAACTVYTSGEHCAMCSAAHGWVGLGRIVYAVSSAQYAEWMREWGVPPSPVRSLPIAEVVSGIEAEGPVPEFVEPVRLLHEENVRRRA
ncbi:nucleoside deaminase [Achromobacter mucicolens]|uniref:nucleoside deaminase n=1 Tax=Achromobacter mucicolens TaxID=1389922 RepID=UPI0014698CD1|nr:nucleoside deaminase [Achromobacter mucicolens]CAB3821236.1 tRNA-specific adenosine deaminase [Achromobacter mucicolens]CAB3838270.1 tRNA-specific adenosine deaminase [Achromobacter mucicolens]